MIRRKRSEIRESLNKKRMVKIKLLNKLNKKFLNKGFR